MRSGSVTALDLVQEALTKVAMRWDRLRTTNPDAYARAVMYHDSISWWRKRRHEAETASPRRSLRGRRSPSHPVPGRSGPVRTGSL
jgi:DNA-directed RNA polymerase specialized sigma24 family protein